MAALGGGMALAMLGRRWCAPAARPPMVQDLFKPLIIFALASFLFKLLFSDFRASKAIGKGFR
eukprot:10709704-Heterocapsa_arctica.AAC.1